jgi:ABC-type antimicrobial peptide transport system permease subunit
MALGAGVGHVLRLVLSESLVLAGIGLGAGVVVALLASRWIRTLLFETAPTDPLAFVSSAILLMGAALLAALVPAQRAARIDPHQALRAE